jgi:hypothetical protein
MSITMEGSTPFLVTSPRALKRVALAVLAAYGVGWCKAGSPSPSMATAIAVFACLVAVLEFGRKLLDFEALETVMVNSLFSGLVQRTLQLM